MSCLVFRYDVLVTSSTDDVTLFLMTSAQTPVVSYRKDRIALHGDIEVLEYDKQVFSQVKFE